MISKWVIYFLTFLSYACFHSIRSAWAGLKNLLYSPPFDYNQDYLGIIDMLVVLSLAITLTTFGHNVQLYGAKKCLIIGMSLLSTLTFIIGILLLAQVTSTVAYILLFGLGVGIISATGWPSCLYILSQNFTKKNNTALPIWNGTSQFGDFIALFVSDIIIDLLNANGAISLLIIPVIMFVLVVLNAIYLPADQKGISVQNIIKDSLQLNEEKETHSEDNQENNKSKISQKSDISSKSGLPKQNKVLSSIKNNNENIENIEKDRAKSQPNFNLSLQKSQVNKEINNILSKKASSTINTNNQNLTQSNKNIYTDFTPVTFFNVWCLPGVALYVMASSVIKSINTIIMTWLVFYLQSSDFDMKQESRIIAILWAFGVFGGGIIGGIVNKQYSKKIFIFSLIIAGTMFITLENLHQKIYKTQIVFSIVICSLAYGGPYSMLGTAVPIMLGQKQGIKNRVGAKSAVISLMQGFPLFVCAFSIILVPLIGIKYIHLVLFGYCIVACIILAVAVYLDRNQLNKVPSESNSEREQNGENKVWC